MKKYLLTTYILLGAFLLQSCHQHDHEDEHGHDHEIAISEDEHDHGGGKDANEVILSAEQMRMIDVQFGQLEMKQLTAVLNANGILKVPNQNKAAVTSLYGGVIKNIYVTPGAYVQKGQAVASISNTSFIAMQEEFLTVAEKLVLASLELSRQIDLQSGNAGALKNLQAAEAEYNALQTRKSSLSKQLNMLGISSSNLSNDNIKSEIIIKSPIKGVVSEIDVNIGSYVDMNTPIAGVVDNSQLHVDLFVYEKDLNKLKIGQTIHFTLTNNPIKEYDAEIHAISNTFEENIKAVSVHAEVKGDKNGLIDGMSVIASVSLKDAETLAVPLTALVNNNGQDYIIIYHEKDSSFVRVPVLKGTSDVGYCEIMPIMDIAPDTKIVTKGAFFILAKMTNQGEAHDH